MSIGMMIPVPYSAENLYGKLQPRPCTECTGRGPHTPAPGQHPYSPSRFKDLHMAYVVGYLTCGLEARYEMHWFSLGTWHVHFLKQGTAELLHVDIKL